MSCAPLTVAHLCSFTFREIKKTLVYSCLLTKLCLTIRHNHLHDFTFPFEHSSFGPELLAICKPVVAFKL
jgi:hypothetical protein